MKEERNQVPETYVLDKELAEVGACAEKPIRDVIKKYKKELHPENRILMEEVAQILGQETMDRYDNDKKGISKDKRKSVRYLSREIDLMLNIVPNEE